MVFKRYWIVLALGVLFLSACGVIRNMTGGVPGNEKLLDGQANAANGERIYFTATSARGDPITYSGPNFGGMMMGSYLTCAACHGPYAGGGKHTMHMQVMDAPSITYASLSEEMAEHLEESGSIDEHSEYGLEQFRLAVIEGKHPDGDALKKDMPRWQMSDEDLADLLEFLKSIQ